MLWLLVGCATTGVPPQPTPQAQAMQHMLADINQVRSYVYGGASQADAAQAADELLAWSRRLAELFPPGQASTNYVDMSPERASGAPAAMIHNADLLLAAVRSGNRATSGDQLARTEREGCGFCHLSGTR
jgi:hypothetical protein